MSPISVRNFRQTQTTLDLNGPTLSFTQNPISQNGAVGDTETFVGLATATFPQSGRATNTGIVSYRWYEGTVPLTDSTNVTGTNTNTLTISNLSSPSDNGRSFSLQASYIPSAYGSGVTGNAYNSPIRTDEVKLSVFPSITITTQPTNQSVGINNAATFTVAATTTDISEGILQYQWTLDGVLTSNINPTATFTPTSVGIQTVQAIVYQNTDNGVIQAKSNVVNLECVALRKLLKFEAFDSNNQMVSTEVDLDTTSTYTLTSSTFGSTYNVIQMFAPEQGVTLDMEIKASAGKSYNGSALPGEGGVSNVRLPIDSGVEHTIIGVAGNSAVFLYKGSVLIAVVGQGGDESSSNVGTVNGGRGGGIGVAGENSIDNDGGALIQTGDLQLTGVWGSIVSSSNITLQGGDTLATGNNGGQTISCTKGTYWINQGISVCSNNSSNPIKYVGVGGTEISGSSQLIRGFKPGYSISNTSGKGLYGNGGNGATGGQGSNSSTKGSGGGSGYTNGEVQVISTQLGGNTTQLSSITFTLSS